MTVQLMPNFSEQDVKRVGWPPQQSADHTEQAGQHGRSNRQRHRSTGTEMQTSQGPG